MLFQIYPLQPARVKQVWLMQDYVKIREIIFIHPSTLFIHPRILFIWIGWF